MRFQFFAITILFLVSPLADAQNKKDIYRYTLDLTKVVNDRVYVELSPPPITTDEITFYLPKIIPGTYAIADYGRYVADISAVDKKGKKLQIERIEDNAWKIRNAKKLTKISYYVDDTWDTEVDGPEIFWPAGTNIEEAKNYVINTSGFFGYFEGKKELPFQFSVVRTKDLYGSTGLIPVQSGISAASVKLEKGNTRDKVVDVFKTIDYDQLVDSPLMYSKPDTAIVRVANTEVLIGSYSPNGKIKAKEIAGAIKEVLMAQKEFLGGELPVEKYAFIFYFTDQPVTSYGALEHSYSSLYYMPEMPIDQAQQQLQDVAAHEFFHIVTPLTVHSEEIADFDFNKPKMSQHLWMYEGVTEYFAGLVLVRHGLIGPDQYVQMLQEKMLGADQFDQDLAFTDLSKQALERHDQYYNVYQKGALIGLCLDIKLRKLSNGKYGLQNLLLDLSKKYGKDKAFKDDELFDEITKMTYPEIGEFFNRYVKGTEPLPLKEVFQDVGIDYDEEETLLDYSIGIDNDNITVGEVDGKQKLKIGSDKFNEMAKSLGFKEGDLLIKMNGQNIPDLGPDFAPFIQAQMFMLPNAKTLNYTVLRADSTGALQEVELSAPVKKVELHRRHNLAPLENVTPEQIALRDAWLKAE